MALLHMPNLHNLLSLKFFAFMMILLLAICTLNDAHTHA